MLSSLSKESRAVRLPPGFLGTRADILMDVVLIAMLVTPFLLVWTIRLARRGAYVQHRNLQTALLCVLLAAAALFEVDVRVSGGADAFLTGSRYLGTPILRWLLRVHIAVAVATFAAWTYVVANIWRGGIEPKPDLVGPSHRRTGYLIFAGVTFTSISGACLYWLGFVS